MPSSSPSRFTQLTLNPRFARLWLAVGTSNLADGMGVAAAPLLAASLTRDPLLVAGLTVVQRLPWLLFSVLTGALADRMDRRKALAIANIVRAGSLGALGSALALGWANLWLLYLVFFLMGIAETLFDNASFAILPSVVARDGLEGANSRLFTTTMLSNEFVGPPLGSFLFAAVLALPFYLGSGFYAMSAVLILMLRGRYRSESASAEESTPLWQDVAEGFTWFWCHPLLRTLSLWAAVSNLVSGAVYGILVLFAQERLGLTNVGYGLLLAAGSVGGMVGGISAGWLAKKLESGTLMLLTNLLVAGSYASVALNRNAVVVGVLLTFISFVFLVQNVVVVSLRQAIIPDALLGRVTSAYRMIVLTGLPLGAFLGGLAAKHLGLASPFIGGGILLAIVAFLILPVVNNEKIRAARTAATPGDEVFRDNSASSG